MRFVSEVVGIVEVGTGDVGAYLAEWDLDVGKRARGDAVSACARGDIHSDGGSAGNVQDGGEVGLILDKSPVAGHAVFGAVEEE